MERDKNGDKSDTFYQPRFSFIYTSTSFNMSNSKEYIKPNLINLRSLAGISKYLASNI